MIISDKKYDEERALYNLCDSEVIRCKFEGPADGESVLKEARNIKVTDSDFSLRYPLWHVDTFELKNVSMDELTRAALWYSFKGKIVDSKLNGIKCLRECGDIKIENTTSNSPEFGWKCKNIEITNSELVSEYFMFESENVKLKDTKFKGKYSFQYNKNLVIEDSILDTKDAFWHAVNVTVKNCKVKGEYLGWYSENLTFINCEIEGTQPLCYCKNLKLIDCTMKDTDLSFEYSDVEATINGSIMSVKNPHSGKIVADKIDEIILENSVLSNDCIIEERK